MTRRGGPSASLSACSHAPRARALREHCSLCPSLREHDAPQRPKSRAGTIQACTRPIPGVPRLCTTVGLLSAHAHYPSVANPCTHAGMCMHASAHECMYLFHSILASAHHLDAASCTSPEAASIARPCASCLSPVKSGLAGRQVGTASSSRHPAACRQWRRRPSTSARVPALPVVRTDSLIRKINAIGATDPQIRHLRCFDQILA